MFYLLFVWPNRPIITSLVRSAAAPHNTPQTGCTSGELRLHTSGSIFCPINISAILIAFPRLPFLLTALRTGHRKTYTNRRAKTKFTHLVHLEQALGDTDRRGKTSHCNASRFFAPLFYSAEEGCFLFCTGAAVVAPPGLWVDCICVFYSIFFLSFPLSAVRGFLLEHDRTKVARRLLRQ